MVSRMPQSSDLLRQSDIISTALNDMGGGRTDAEREAQGSYQY